MNSETKIIVSLGSNCNQKENIEYAKRKLVLILGKDTRFTENLWTEPIGIESDRFINCLCISTTQHSLQQISRAFKHIEKQCKRSKKNDKCNKITLDIDILQYGENRLHENDWNRDYIKALMDGLDDKSNNFIIDPTLTRR